MNVNRQLLKMVLVLLSGVIAAVSIYIEMNCETFQGVGGDGLLLTPINPSILGHSLLIISVILVVMLALDSNRPVLIASVLCSMVLTMLSVVSYGFSFNLAEHSGVDYTLLPDYFQYQRFVVDESLLMMCMAIQAFALIDIAVLFVFLMTSRHPARKTRSEIDLNAQEGSSLNRQGQEGVNIPPLAYYLGDECPNDGISFKRGYKERGGSDDFYRSGGTFGKNTVSSGCSGSDGFSGLGNSGGGGGSCGGSDGFSGLGNSGYSGGIGDSGGGGSSCGGGGE